MSEGGPAGGKPRDGEAEFEVVRGSEAATPGSVGLDPSVFGRVPPVVSVRTAHGRSLLVRAVPSATASGRGAIELDRDQIQYLKPKYRDSVLVSPVEGEVPVARRTVLESLFPLSGSLAALEQEIGRIWGEQGLLLQPGLVLRVELPDYPRPTPFRVAAVEPCPAAASRETRVLLRPSTLSAGQAANLATFGDIGGLDHILNELRELVEAPLRDPELFQQVGIEMPRGVLLWGPPGGGKTYTARAVTNEIGAHFLYVNGPEIVSGVQGGTEANLRRIFEEAMEHSPAVVLIDELDSVAPARGEGSSQADIRLTSQLLGLLDGLVQMDQVVVIGSTNRVHAIDPALRRPGRLDRELYVGPPDQRGRLEILTIHTRKMPLEPEAEEYLTEVARRTPGYVGADLVDLARVAGMNALRRSFGPGFREVTRSEAPTVAAADFAAALRATRPSALRETLLRASEASFSDLAGVDDVLEVLEDAVVAPWQHRPEAAELGLTPPKGILIHGPRGTGKSLLARAIASEIGANYLPVQGPEIFSQWLGQSEAAVRHVFQVATKVAPAAIVIDPIDPVAPNIALGATTPAQERVREQLIIEIDSLADQEQVLVIGVTSHPESIDGSLLRAGRLGLHVAVGLPDEAGRAAILQRGLAHELGREGDEGAWGEAIGKVAAAFAGASGADLFALLSAARRMALRHVLDRRSGGAGSPTLRLEPDHLLSAWSRRQEAGPQWG